MICNKIPKVHVLSLLWILLLWVITSISPLDRYDWFMENILFFVFFITLIISYKKFQFSNLSYIFISIFLTFHLVGAHYTYSKVPLGFELSEIFNLNRNHYDRIVHFLFGLLLTYPIQEFLSKTSHVKTSLSIYIACNAILAFGAIFEIIEWCFVLVTNPELGNAYLGSQGDIWDAQQDMTVALVGSIIAAIILLVRNSKMEKSRNLE